MLKKVMAICLAFSFVLIGGIAFAGNEEPSALQEGQISSELEQSSGDVIPPEPTDLSTHDSETIIAEGDDLKQGQQQEEAVEDGDGKK